MINCFDYINLRPTGELSLPGSHQLPGCLLEGQHGSADHRATRGYQWKGTSMSKARWAGDSGKSEHNSVQQCQTGVPTRAVFLHSTFSDINRRHCHTLRSQGTETHLAHLINREENRKAQNTRFKQLCMDLVSYTIAVQVYRCTYTKHSRVGNLGVLRLEQGNSRDSERGRWKCRPGMGWSGPRPLVLKLLSYQDT